MALPVLSTSSPSSRPEIRVSPTPRAPKMRARCEIDLSPGTRTRPLSAPERRAVSGAGLACDTAGKSLEYGVTSAADLKFLQHLQQIRSGTSNRKAALEP